jgi:hypothetical protein
MVSIKDILMKKGEKAGMYSDWKPKPHEERKVTVSTCVKRKHFAEFKKLITELAKPYR